MYNSVSFTLVSLYRSPHSKQNKCTNKMFLDQFPDFLLSLSDGNGEIIVGDDFNFRFENEHDNKVCKLRSLLNDCCLKQLVNQPILSLWPHLGLGYCPDDSPIVHCHDVIDTVLSEHRTVFCKLAMRRPTRAKQQP